MRENVWEKLKPCLYFYVLMAACILLMWIPPLFRGFWVDETITAWLTQGDFASVFEKCYTTHFFSLYYWIAWVTARFAGSSEMVLRLPSLFAMLWALRVVLVLTRELFDEECSICAGIVFAAHPLIVFQASNARPYALGILATTLAMLFFHRFLATTSVKNGIACALCLASSVYVHPFFGQSVLACLFMIIASKAAKERDFLNKTAFAGAILILVLVPALFIYRPLLNRGGMLVFSDAPSMLAIIDNTFPLAYVAGIAVMLAATTLFCGCDFCLHFRDGFKENAILCSLSWALVPPAVMLLITFMTPYKLFIPRYMSAMLPGSCLLLALPIRAAGAKPYIKKALLTALVAFSLVSFSNGHTWYNDWCRPVTAAASELAAGDEKTPVLINTGLIEADSMAWVADVSKREYLLAPLTVYPLHGRHHLLPYGTTGADAKRYVTNLLDGVHDRFIYLGTGRYSAYFKNEVAKRGYRGRLLTRSRGEDDLGPVAIEYRR